MKRVCVSIIILLIIIIIIIISRCTRGRRQEEEEEKEEGCQVNNIMILKDLPHKRIHPHPVIL